MIMNYNSSTPMAWNLILKPVFKAYNLNNKVNKLLDFYEVSTNEKAREKAYSRALNLQKQSNKLLGISRQCLSSRRKTGGRGSFALHFSPVSFKYLPMDFKEYLEKRLMMKELQLMKAEDKGAHEGVIIRLFSVVKELRFIYKQLFWRNKK